jgi:hypothetical protein
MPAIQFGGGGDASPLLASLRCPTPLAADAASCDQKGLLMEYDER